MIKKCEFCNLEKDIMSTAFVESYCIDCHRSAIQQSEGAIRALGRREKNQSTLSKPELDKLLPEEDGGK